MSTPEPLTVCAAAEPAVVGQVRRRIRGWLAEAIEDADVVDDLVLAVNEAVENVVDHAFADAPRSGSILVRAVRDDTHVTITVADDGRWQSTLPQDGPSYRGRGLGLIEQLAQRSSVTTGPSGTTVTLVHQG